LRLWPARPRIRVPISGCSARRSTRASSSSGSWLGVPCSRSHDTTSLSWARLAAGLNSTSHGDGSEVSDDLFGRDRVTGSLGLVEHLDLFGSQILGRLFGFSLRRQLQHRHASMIARTPDAAEQRSRHAQHRDRTRVRVRFGRCADSVSGYRRTGRGTSRSSTVLRSSFAAARIASSQTART